MCQGRSVDHAAAYCQLRQGRVADAEKAGLKAVLFLVQSGGELRFVPLAIGG